MSGHKNSNYQISLPIILCIGLAGGVLLGSSFGTGGGKKSSGKDIQKLREVVGLIESEYVDETDTGPLVEEAIEQMLSKLDPHSVYISASDRQEVNEDLQGNFEGIGIEFSIFHDTLVVVTPLSGGPSEAVGLRSGDKIVKVDDKSIGGVGLTNAQVMKYLKGPKGTEVKIEVLRSSSSSPLSFTIIRDKIPQFSVDASYMIEPEIGYIKVNRFSQTTYQEFHDALTGLKKKGMKKLILDLQGNPGGLMNQAIDMTDDFLPDNQRIVFTRSHGQKYDSEANSTKAGEFEQGDLIVLVNEGSASASEIVAGALQDNDRALIIGRRSYGKGLVQSPFELNDGSQVRLTISRYYTPSGRSIQKPYNNGENYSADISSRYSHGEFFHADSIQFNDSLKYQTVNGRTVYGGGGIMPDYFVPLDTQQFSAYLNKLYVANAIREYTFNFAEDQKSKLTNMGFEKFADEFTVTDAMLNQLVETGKLNKVNPDYADLKKNKTVFQIHVKSLIARQVWGNDGYFPIINETNEILKQAVKMFDRIPELNRTKM